MTIRVTVLADTENFDAPDCRLTTLHLYYPYAIHAQLMTHRVFSRNASSSRAIPVKRMIAAIEADPYIPTSWGSNQRGMDAGPEIDTYIRLPGRIFKPEWGKEEAWLEGMRLMIELAEAYADAGYAKQIVNRLLAPWMHMNTVLSSTEWSNFFHQRLEDADPPMMALARAIKDALHESKPVSRSGRKNLHKENWHLPWVTDEEREAHRLPELQKLSVARCAHSSYMTVEGEPFSLEKASDVFDKMLAGEHWSPFEHVAIPDYKVGPRVWYAPEDHGNFFGFRQFRRSMNRGIGNRSAVIG